MSRHATPIVLTPEDATAVRRWARAGSTEQRLAERARIVLLAAQGQATATIAQTLRTRPARVAKWRTRFARERLAGRRLKKLRRA